MAAEPQRQPWPYNWTAYIVNILTEIKMNASGTMRKITGLANGSSGTYDGCNVKQMEDHVAAAIGDMIDKGEVDAATTAALPANTRTANVLKADVVGAFPIIDGVAASLNNTYLVKNEGGGASHINNGLYTLTVLGDGATEWELTRNSNLTGGDLAAGAYIHIQQGADPDITYRCVNNTGSDVVNTDALEWRFWGQTVDHQYLKNREWSSAGHIMDKYFAGKCVDEATGDNTNGDGTFAYPYKTYQKAIDVSLDNEIYIIAAPNVASQAVSVPAGKKVYIMLLQGSDSLGSTGQITTLTLAEGSLFSGKSIDILAFNDSAVATFAHVYMENGEISTVTSGSTKTIFELHGTTIDSATWTYLNINAAGLNGNANVKNVFTSKDGFDASGEKLVKLADGVASDDGAAFGQIGSAISAHAGLPSVHHARYTDAEAVIAMGVKGDGNPLNHDRCVSYKVWEESLGESTNATLVFSNKVVKAFVIPTADDYKVSFSAEVSHSDSRKGTRVRLGLGQFAITAVNQGTKVFTIAGDYTSLFIAGRLMQIQSSTGNDKTYNVVSSILNVTNTEITVAEVIPSAVVDGDIYACIRVLVETIDKTENDDDYQEVSGFGIVNLPNAMSKNIYLCFASDTDTKTAYMRGAVVEMDEVI